MLTYAMDNLFAYFPYKQRKKENATPLFDWGKYYEKNGRFYMPISVQVHHSFADGIHIGKFAEKLQSYFNTYQ